jgi:hypothetical protein
MKRIHGKDLGYYLVMWGGSPFVKSRYLQGALLGGFTEEEALVYLEG